MTPKYDVTTDPLAQRAGSWKYAHDKIVHIVVLGDGQYALFDATRQHLLHISDWDELELYLDTRPIPSPVERASRSARSEELKRQLMASILAADFNDL